MNVNREMLAFLRKQYPVGTRIRLDSMQDPYAPVEAGMTGKLDYIDDAGQFHMKWDNGRALALIPGVDSFTVLPPELSMTKLYMPLTAELYEPDVYGNMQEEPELLTGHDLTAYEDHIRSALVKYRMPEEVNRGIMHWYDAADSVNDKVRSVTFSVERRNGKLWGNVQIFALVHPVVQPVGGKSMTKVIKTRGTSAGSRNTCFLQNQAESLLQPSLPVKTALRVGKERLAFRHSGSHNGIAI